MADQLEFSFVLTGATTHVRSVNRSREVLVSIPITSTRVLVDVVSYEISSRFSFKLFAAETSAHPQLTVAHLSRTS